MSRVKIKSGDTAVNFTAALKVNDSAVDLTNATVLFLLKPSNSPQTAYSFSASIVSAAAGTVSYSPGDGFPVIAGTYFQEWQVAFSDNSILTFPSSGYNKVIIEEDLN